LRVADHASLIFFRAGSGNLDTAAAALADRGMVVQRQASEFGDELTVGFRSGPQLRVAFVAEPYVCEEAEELSTGSPHAAEMSRCEVRYEVLIDDLDAVLDEINTLIDVQAALQGTTHGFLFNTWNGALHGPEENDAEPPVPAD
jgi:hypothetical protein